MRKKVIAILSATTLLISSVCTVYAANYCAGSTVFQNSKTRALATTYCSYVTSDYTSIAILHATDVAQKSYTTSNSQAGIKTV